jgi:two-component system, OmpR family, phosphate regulon sensor histidine kinase PhoR
MNESPSLVRSSKTATVVVLVVFLQLIVIAVLGLGAISRDRREGARDAATRADADAVAAAESNIRRVQAEVGEILKEAVAVATPEELRLLKARSAGKLVDLVYVLETNGTVRWLGGDHRLWIPPAVIAALESREVQGEADAARVREQFIQASQAGAYGQALTHLRYLLASQALRVSPEGYPEAVGWAAALIDHAMLAIEVEPGSIGLRQLLLTALEIEAINRGRPELAADVGPAMLALVHERVEAAVACELDRDALLEMIGEFRRARDQLERLRPALEEAARRHAAVEQEPGSAGLVRVLQASGEVFAVVRSERVPHYVTLVRVLPEEARALCNARVDVQGLERQGLRLEFQRMGSAASGRPLWTQDLPRENVLELPVRAALYRDRPLPLPAGGPTETFYLVIIGLAALGLLVGAVVLVRMWRREVRLARLKADFVSNLSHELKTPLTSIQLFTEMLQEGKLATEEEKAEGLAVLAQESQRLQRIVARMIDVARREARGTPYDLAPGDLNLPLREAALRFRRIVTEPGLDLEVRLAPEPLPVLMDRAAVDDVVTNLLSNAWKYKRGERARIEVTARRRGRKAEVVVSDDGIGIPREERKRVFQMFYRAENYLTRSVAGTGLGLALVRTIVRAHRGRIRIEAGPGGVGTTFRIRLPLTRKPFVPPSPGASLSPAALSPASGPSEREPSAP